MHVSEINLTENNIRALFKKVDSYQSHVRIAREVGLIISVMKQCGKPVLPLINVFNECNIHAGTLYRWTMPKGTRKRKRA
jgi:hypothetical protein